MRDIRDLRYGTGRALLVRMNANDKTAIVSVLARQSGKWREIVMSVPEAQALDACKAALKRKGVVRIKCASWTFDARDAAC